MTQGSQGRERAAPFVQVDRKRPDSLFSVEADVQTCGQRGTARGRWCVLTGICLRPEREQNSWIGGAVFTWPCTDSTSLTTEAPLLHPVFPASSPERLWKPSPRCNISGSTSGVQFAGTPPHICGTESRSLSSKHISAFPISVFWLHCGLARGGGVLASPPFQGLLRSVLPGWWYPSRKWGDDGGGQCWFSLERGWHETHLWNLWGLITHPQHVLDIHI